MKKLLSLLATILVIPLASRAELKLPAIIGDHMVLQQNQANPIWGWDTPGTNVTVSFAGQSHSATAGADGRWTVKLAPLPANATPQTLTVMGSTQRELQDVLIGEVWMCSGQSNMEWSLGQSTNGDIEAAASKLPNLRLITVPNVGTQELQDNFNGEWEASTPRIG
jgi:sialate O-acetylesterase